MENLAFTSFPSAVRAGFASLSRLRERRISLAERKLGLGNPLRARAGASVPTPYSSPTLPRRKRVRGYGHQQGFTLIEMAIVVMIIGLIVGGILVGRDLIGAAAVRAQITQLEKFNTAVNTFRDKYGGLPGDLTVNLANTFGFIVPADCTGIGTGRNGNGLIEGQPGAPFAALMGENALFWMDLGNAGLINGTFLSGWTSNGGGWNGLCTYAVGVGSANLGNYIPPASIGYGNSIHVYSNSGNNWFMLADIISSNSDGGSDIHSSPTLPVLLAYKLDQKIDDGIPNTGRVQAVYVTGWSVPNAPNAPADNATTCYNTTTTPAAYSISYNNGAGVNCALSFRMQAGD